MDLLERPSDTIEKCLEFGLIGVHYLRSDGNSKKYERRYAIEPA
jgi:hypothetical protein